MPVKKAISIKKTAIASSLRGRLGGRGNLPRKIASSLEAPRNDKKVSSRAVSLSVVMYSLTGKAVGTLALPKEVFGQKVNKKLLTQAIRVYSVNRKTLPGSTKTRGEVEGSTAKIYNQKGTGRARHGALRAPIFVGGGIVFGPKPRRARLELPQKMRKAALVSALSSKMEDKNVIGLSGADKATGKTKEVSELIKHLKFTKTLIVVGDKMNNMVRASRNIIGLTIMPVNQLNAYEVLRHKFLIMTKESLEKFK